jgi:hypothetical protein
MAPVAMKPQKIACKNGNVVVFRGIQVEFCWFFFCFWRKALSGLFAPT